MQTFGVSSLQKGSGHGFGGTEPDKAKLPLQRQACVRQAVQAVCEAPCRICHPGLVTMIERRC